MQTNKEKNNKKPKTKQDVKKSNPKPKNSKGVNKKMEATKVKVEETKVEEVKAEETKMEETKVEESKVEEIVSEVINEESKEEKIHQSVMNLRPDIKREDFGVEMWIDVNDLEVDSDTQRSSMENHVRKILKNFDAKAFGRVSVSKRADGKYYVTDGWHRTLACRSLGIKEIPCIVIPNEEKEEKFAKKNDALQFLKINENSSSVSAIDKYKIGVSGEIEEWLRVKECVEANGLVVGTSATKINAVASIYKYINSSQKTDTIAKKMEHMKIALGILNDITGVEGITNISINAMCLFVREYISEGIITVEDTLNAFSKVNVKQMITSAQTLKNMNAGGNIITSLAYLFYKEYNNATKGEKLPPRFEI